MSADVKCAPGANEKAPALPNRPVALTRAGGFPDQQGTVKLKAADGAVPMDPKKWTPAAITATVPGQAPGKPPFKVEIQVGNQTFTGTIDVRSVPGDGSGYPPART